MTQLQRWACSLCLVLSVSVNAQMADTAISSRPLNPASDQNITVLDQKVALAASQAAIGQQMPDVALLDRKGSPVRLHDFKGKPLLVSFMYTGCFQVCPTTTKNLQKALNGAVSRLGPDAFNVISIGFNQPSDSPQALKSFANQNGMNLPNWEFLSPTMALVPELASAFGFRYVQTAAGFDHLNQVTLVDKYGRIVRQIYGTTFTAEMLTEPLTELSNGKELPPESRPLDELIDKVILLCSRYDPLSGRYRVDYRIFMEAAGLVTFLLVMIWFIWGERRRTRLG